MASGGGQSGNSPGGGMGGDDSNSGPRGDINDVNNTTAAPFQVGESGTIFSAGETTGAPDSVNASKVPYTEVYSDYSRTAEDALSNEKVPPAYRTRVKEYFSSLE